MNGHPNGPQAPMRQRDLSKWPRYEAAALGLEGGLPALATAGPQAATERSR